MFYRIISKNINNSILVRHFYTTKRTAKKFENVLKKVSVSPELDKILDEVENKILYNTLIDSKKYSFSYRKHKIVEDIIKKGENDIQFQMKHTQPFPSALKYYLTDNEQIISETKSENKSADSKDLEIVQFPFENVNINNLDAKRLKEIEENVVEDDTKVEEQEKVPSNWMSDYEVYPEEISEEETESWRFNYGTPNPNAKISKVPCGGCGALLHCKDASIPGYIPSEIFENVTNRELSNLICQRCHFLKTYNTALQVRVSSDEYPKILSVIKSKRALVILMVDLLDFPCSIWPNIMDIIGHKRPVIVVGNKIDLLPQDSRGFLKHIRTVLKQQIEKSSISKANIKHIALISAKTGYGVEDLITVLHSEWEYRGDVFLVGCTNVGKSSLFNALLQSDYCKVQAVDLIQRATTSVWPGTTLNLLKFPILRPSGWRLYLRTKRLIAQQKDLIAERDLRKSRLKETNNPAYASLIGHIDRTFSPEEPVGLNEDPFSVRSGPGGPVKKMLNENDPDYKESKWCYDTPGVIQPDQILNLLTTEELMLTLPRHTIRPRSFRLNPGMTLFVAGIARLDVTECENPKAPLRFTVMASNELPVTICYTHDADSLYEKLLGTELFKVPQGNYERLEKWPPLKASDEIKITGEDWKTSSADIVLSSAGWIAVTPGPQLSCKVKAWTPEGRGIYVRKPPLLPYAVNMRGKLVRSSPAYRTSKFLNFV